MPDFQGNTKIKIYKNTGNYPIRMEFPVSEYIGGGGTIPYGNIISNVVIRIYNSLGEEVTNLMVSSTSIEAPNIVKTNLSYFPNAIEGKYNLKTILTFSPSGYSEEFNAKRIWVINE